jgi:tRNA G46 methylase TrmB
MEFHVRASIGHRIITFPLNRIQGLGRLRWKHSWMTDVLEHLVGIKPGTFVDIGANIGQTLLSLQATHPEVGYIGFEPNVRCAAYLDDLIKSNCSGLFI